MMTDRFPDDVLREAAQAYSVAYAETMRSTSNEWGTANRAGYAAMRAVLEGHLTRACTDNPLQNQLLDLITLMPNSQIQEIVDYIFALRVARGAVVKP